MLMFLTDNRLRMSRRNTTRLLLEKSTAPAPAVSSLDEAVKPKIEALTRDTDQALEQRFRKMSGVSNSMYNGIAYTSYISMV